MSQLNDFLVRITDKPNMLATRTSNVQAHIAGLKGHVESGTIVMSGPILAEHPKTADEGLPITGSAWLVRANSEEDVRAIIANDVYAKIGVWDVDNVSVTPFKCILRKPL
ncbi:hypothetical protein F4804DRAFT_311547 [Jackrogersella minutella]|nr:hypothetical protein F4804DRAFT_311547 [Jackrogersella minutella]